MKRLTTTMADVILALKVLVVFMILWIIAAKVERDVNGDK